MPIFREQFNDGQADAIVVHITDSDEIQLARVIPDELPDADQLWFFRPCTGDIQDDELKGVTIDMDLIKGDMVVLKFSNSAAILPIIRELTILYGSLFRLGL